MSDRCVSHNRSMISSFKIDVSIVVFVVDFVAVVIAAAADVIFFYNFYTMTCCCGYWVWIPVKLIQGRNPKDIYSW